MALQKNAVTSSGLVCNNAYHRVGNVTLINKVAISFSVLVSKNKEMPFFSDYIYYCDYDINGANPIKQAYEHLKTLPEFADATDV